MSYIRKHWIKDKIMASARSRLGAARRGIIRRKRKTDVATGILGAAATVTAFGAGQAKKAKTAWGEYEAGYKELGGTETITRPKFGQKGFFKGPSGDVRIGDTMYDRGKIRKAGSFLGSDAAAILSDEQRSKYMGRMAPGKSRFAEGLEGPGVFKQTTTGNEFIDRSLVYQQKLVSLMM